MLRCGVDIIEIKRIAKAVKSEHGKRFLKKIYTAFELEHFENNIPELAARWAGKEAVSKMLGLGLLPPSPLNWGEIEIIPDTNGKPRVYLYGNSQKRAEKLNIREIDISFSHTAELAIAFVVSH